MRVLHVVPTYLPAYKMGGPIKAVHSLCRSLSQKGVNTSVYTTNLDSSGHTDVALNTPVDIDGVSVTYFPVTIGRRYNYSRALGRALGENIMKFDLLHIHSVFLYPTAVASYLCRKYNVPYIINPLGALDPDMINFKNSVLKQCYIKLIEKNNINNATAIHLASSYEQDKFRLLGFRTRVVVVPRGVDLKNFPEKKIQITLKELYPETEGKKVVLFMGRLHPKKGFALLAKAFKRIVDKKEKTHLLIAGTGENKYVNKVRLMFKRLNIEKHVTFAGMILGDEKIAALQGSDLFVLPSHGENFGVAVVEAMAFGLPVVVTDRVGLWPDIKEYGAGVVVGPSVEEIEKAILRLVEKDELSKSMGVKARQLVGDRFDIRKIANKMTTIYREIIQEKDA